MKIIYLVTWLLITSNPVPCDCNKPYQDEFGRTIQNSYTVICYEERETKQSREFQTLDEAESFVKRGKESWLFGYKLTDFEIEEIVKKEIVSQ